MPIIYLSPSTQEGNMYVIGGSEEAYMNRLADRLEPYLRANLIRFDRNTPDMTAASSIRASNAGNYDLHLALHSNAAPEGQYGQQRGSEVYYYPASVWGQRAANAIAEHLRTVYPLGVRTLPSTTIGELRLTSAPAAFIELAYHDNVADATWIAQNMDSAARAIANGLTDYFGIPFATPLIPPRTGAVTLASGTLNVRSYPSLNAPVIAGLGNGTLVTIVGEVGDWYAIERGELRGYVSKNYIR